MNATVVDLESKHAKLRAKLVKYGVNVDSMAGEANMEKGWGAASHGPKPISDGDKYRVAEIHNLAMRHNKVVELERSAWQNMQRAGIRNEKHLDALIAKRDGKDAPVEKEEFVDPYASMEDSDLPPVDGTTAGIAIRCAEGEKLYHTGGYTIGDSELGFHQTLAFCHVIGQCSAVETAARKADHESVRKKKTEAAAAKLQLLSASIQKGVNTPSEKELRNITKTAALKAKSAGDAEKAASERKSALAMCVNSTVDFVATLKEQKVSEGDIRGLLKNLCLSQLIMPAHPRGITRYSAHLNCERASRVLDNVGNAPTTDDLGEYCAQVAAGDTPPVDAPPFEMAPYLSDAAKLEKEEREEMAEGLQSPVNHDVQAEKLGIQAKKLQGRLHPRADISDAKWDEAISGVSEKSTTVVSNLNNIVKKLVDGKASTDQRVQKDTETLKYATDLVSEEAPVAALGKRSPAK
jgi:signal recognition particle subunit SEC65